MDWEHVSIKWFFALLVHHLQLIRNEKCKVLQSLDDGMLQEKDMFPFK